MDLLIGKILTKIFKNSSKTSIISKRLKLLADLKPNKPKTSLKFVG
jgi:hypothetical protein